MAKGELSSYPQFITKERYCDPVNHVSGTKFVFTQEHLLNGSPLTAYAPDPICSHDPKVIYIPLSHPGEALRVVFNLRSFFNFDFMQIVQDSQNGRCPSRPSYRIIDHPYKHIPGHPRRQIELSIPP